MLWIGLGLGWAEPVIPGLVRGTLDPELRGQVLIEELNCVACHATEGTLKARSKQAPRLSEVGSRLNPAFLERFIADPHGTQSGTTMPNALAALDAEQRRATAQAITHFLLSPGNNSFTLQPPDAVAAEHGRTLFRARGCIACHPSPEGPTTGTPSRTPCLSQDWSRSSASRGSPDSSKNRTASVRPDACPTCG